MTKWFVYIFLAGVCLLLSCGGKSVREKFAEADRLVNENNLDSAAWLLEEQITLSALSDSDKAEYGWRLAWLHLLQDRSLVNDSLIDYSVDYYKEQTERPIFVREGSKIIRLRREEILFLEGYGDYVKVHRINGKPLLTQVSLKRFEEFLDRNRFCRVHRSYIVSLSHINYIERKRIRIGEELIPISDSYLPALMNNLALQE